MRLDNKKNTSKKDKLVIIDGNAIIHRAYHAMPELNTPNGEPINAVYGFVSMLLKIVEDLNPEYLAVCFDRPEPTFRHKIYKKYQSHRPETDKELISQFQKVRDVVEAFGISMYEKVGYEADDLIGTIAKQVVGKIGRLKADTNDLKVDEVVIVTGDKDQLQLVDDKIKVYLPMRGLSNAKMMGVRDVYGKLGVYPDQVVDYKALVGDPSDNYPGVYGIGPKTAEKLLHDYSNFEGVYKNIDNIGGSVAKKLKEGKKQGEVSYKLAKIVLNVSIDIDLKKMEKWEFYNEKVEQLFSLYGFRSLKKRVEKLSEDNDLEKKSNNQESLF